MSPRVLIAVGLFLGACKKDEPEPPPPEQPKLDKGEACDPSVEPLTEEELEMLEPDTEPDPICAPGLACAPVDGDETHVCGVAVQIEGLVTDSISGEPIAGALVAALDDTGQPVTDVVTTDACGAYVLPLSIRRTPDGELAEMPKWTMIASAQDYQPFPAGLRPALPVDIAAAVPDPDPRPSDSDGEEEDEIRHLAQVIENAATSIALIPLPDDERGGSIVSGTVGAEADERAGTLVVAEGGDRRSPYAIADASGHYTLFNVPSGGVQIRGYRKGLQVEPATITGGADGEHLEAVDLAVVGSGPLATVTGSINIVNAPGGSITSVVLVPASAFNEALERGPVPLGLREPDPPTAPNVSSAFSLEGVPNGTYKVLVAFENDDLVRDPDEGIAGTAIQEITVDAADVSVAESFKVTEALSIVSPGADAPEEVEATPRLVWADDSSEDGYEVKVFDALGTIVWEVDAPRVTGSETVELRYDGPALEAGMYYQFRVISFHEEQAGRLYISRTEDLRGVFFHGNAPEPDACTVEADTEGGTTTGGE